MIAETAGHLTVLQRTPQYSIPAWNAPLTPELVATWLERIKERTAKLASRPAVRRLWEVFGTKSTFDDRPEQREAYFEQLWQMGGPIFSPSDTWTP